MKISHFPFHAALLACLAATAGCAGQVTPASTPASAASSAVWQMVSSIPPGAKSAIVSELGSLNFTQLYQLLSKSSQPAAATASALASKDRSLGSLSAALRATRSDVNDIGEDEFRHALDGLAYQSKAVLTPPKQLAVNAALAVAAVLSLYGQGAQTGLSLSSDTPTNLKCLTPGLRAALSDFVTRPMGYYRYGIDQATPIDDPSASIPTGPNNVWGFYYKSDGGEPSVSMLGNDAGPSTSYDPKEITGGSAHKLGDGKIKGGYQSMGGSTSLSDCQKSAIAKYISAQTYAQSASLDSKYDVVQAALAATAAQ